MNRTLNITIGVMLCLILLASVRNYSWLKLGVGQVYYLGGYTLTALSLYVFFVKKQVRSFTYLAPVLYIIWALIGVYRGAFEVTSGWMLNQYFHSILAVLVPIIIFLFVLPETVICSFQILNIFTIVYSLLSIKWNYTMEAYCFACTPFYYFYLCFLPKIPRKYLILTILLVALVLAAYTNRSAMIKVLVSIAILIVFYLPKLLQRITLRTTYWLCFSLPAIFLYLGISGQYNVFQGKGSEDSYVTVSSNGIEKQKQELRADNRTFLYEEVLASMVINDYVFTGRTPARGYYSPYFASREGITPGKEAGERMSCEVGHLNTLNWLGVIGLLLLTLVYFQGSCLALYHSKNKYVKCLSLAVAFQWLWSWVENINEFHMMDVMIYVLLAICYSPYFRKMSDLEFEMWFRSLFSTPSDELHDYKKYQILKVWFSNKEVNTNHTK